MVTHYTSCCLQVQNGQRNWLLCHGRCTKADIKDNFEQVFDYEYRAHKSLKQRKPWSIIEATNKPQMGTQNDSDGNFNVTVHKLIQ